MRAAVAILIFVVVCAGAGILLIESGRYDISATKQHTALTRWIFSETMDNSVRYHAGDIDAPPLTDSTKILTGFFHYRSMCAECHGAPGVAPEELAAGLNPPAPDLADAAKDWSPAELYWITKNGVKMTGMPAWGPTHTDDELWAVVAFTKQLPGMTPERYRALGRLAQKESPGGHVETHGKSR